MLCWRARIGIVAKWKFSMGFFSRRNKKARARPPAEPDWVAAIVVKMEDKMEYEVTLLADWMNGELIAMKAQLHDIAQNQQGSAISQRETDERIAQLDAQLRAANERNAQAVERADKLDTPLIYEDDERDDWWIVDEHFRDALAHILTHADFRQQK